MIKLFSVPLVKAISILFKREQFESANPMRRALILQRDTVRSASEFAARNHLPPPIQDQMLAHICLKFKTEGLKQQDALNGLPKALRSSIAQHLFFDVVKKAYIFQGVSHDFLFQLVILHMTY